VKPSAPKTKKEKREKKKEKRKKRKDNREKKIEVPASDSGDFFCVDFFCKLLLSILLVYIAV